MRIDILQQSASTVEAQPKLWELIRQWRDVHKWTQMDLAARLKVSPQHVTMLEQSYEKTRRLPSDDLLRRMAEVFSRGNAEGPVTSEQQTCRWELERKLLLARAHLTNPPEIQAFLREYAFVGGVPGYLPDAMPPAFCQRVRDDLEAAGPEMLEKAAGAVSLTPESMQGVVEGMVSLPRARVVALAHLLAQPEDEYLMLAEMLPDALKRVSQRPSAVGLIDVLSQLPVEDLDTVLNSLTPLATALLAKQGTKGMVGS